MQPVPSVGDDVTILQQVKAIRDQIDELRALLPGLEDAYNTETQEYSASKMVEAHRTVEALEDAFRLKARQVTTKLKELKSRLTSAGLQDQDARIISLHHAALLEALRPTLNRYKEINEECRRKHKVAFTNACRIVNPDLTAEDIDDMASQPTESVFKDLFQAEAACEDAKWNHREIVKLQTALEELYEMFLDMAVLIDGQGGLIDSIEHNAIKAAKYVDQARRNVAEAEEIQRSIRARKCCICVWILVIVVIVVIVVVLSI